VSADRGVLEELSDRLVTPGPVTDRGVDGESSRLEPARGNTERLDSDGVRAAVSRRPQAFSTHFVARRACSAHGISHLTRIPDIRSA